MLMLILWELTLQDVVADIPHDAGALVVYTLFALFAGFIWAGSRKKQQDDTGRRGGGAPGG